MRATLAAFTSAVALTLMTPSLAGAQGFMLEPTISKSLW